MSKKNIENIIFFIYLIIIIGFALLGAKILIKKNLLIVDERTTYQQIMLFVKSDWSTDVNIAPVRGYHAFIFLILRLFNNSSYSFLRYLAVGINLISIPIVYLVAKHIDSRSAKITTLQFSFLPILSPFLSLMYNDIFSLTLIILSIYFLLLKKYYLAGVVVVVSMAVRQNNIIWLLFELGFIWLRNGGFEVNKEKILKFFRQTAIHFFGIVLFIIFLIINKGVAAGDRSLNPLALSSLGNVYLMLFLIFFLFLPLCVNSISKIATFIRQNKYVVFFFVLAYFLYMRSFTNPHPFNQSQFFLRNVILVFFTKSTLSMTIFFVIVCFSTLVVFVSPYYYKVGPLLMLSSFIFLSPMWLVEERYFFVPITLFIIFRKKNNYLLETIIHLLFVIYTLILFKGIFIDNSYFL